jgi:hypothetical protein
MAGSRFFVPDPAKLGEVMMRLGLTPAPPSG